MSTSAIALIALAVSVVSLAWHLVKHFLDGARVRVRMYPGLLDDYSLGRSTRSWESLADKHSVRGGWNIEVAILEVENRGRTALTVTEPSLDFGRSKWWSPGRHTVGPLLLNAIGSSTDRTKRLEPFDNVLYVFDVWQILQPLRGNGPRFPLRLRSSVRVAGKRRHQRSPWRKGWRVVPGQVSFMVDRVEIGMAAYRAIWRQTRNFQEESGPYCDRVSVALAVRKEFPANGQAPTKEELRDIIRKNVYGDGAGGQYVAVEVIALYVSLDLEKHYVPSPADAG